ncbi:MAG TPA: hypothetical protein VK892_15165 [Pyrinomonadaceae bacterium]|nr:hypothetical protein [Pyrinomonadaceae bacterium]
MQTLRQTTLIFLSLILFSNIGSAQNKNTPPPGLSPDEAQRINQDQQKRAIEKRDQILDRAKASERDVGVFRKPEVETSPERKAERQAQRREVFENWRKWNQMLLPPAAYYAEYAELLKDKKMNLARIFVDRKCDEGKTVTIQEIERCADVIPVKGGGSFYSFRLKTHRYLGYDWWDIHFLGDRFVVGNNTVQSIISEIGEVDLEEIKLSSKPLKFLNDYKPKRSLAEIKEQNKLLEKGFNSNGFTYSLSAPLKLNSTYVLRSVAYRVNDKSLRIARESRTNVTLAFKVIGREKDGSVIILWKELKTEFPRRDLET